MNLQSLRFLPAVLLLGPISGALAQTFGPPQLIEGALDSIGAVEVWDADGDGTKDLVSAVTGMDALVLHHGAGGLQFDLGVFVGTGSAPRAVLPVDLDGDQDEDLVVACVDQVQAFENLGGGTLAAPVTLTTSVQYASSIVALDDDGDGDLDLFVCAYRSGNVLRIENLSGLAFGPAQDLATGLLGAYQLAAFDLEGDGDQDLACAAYLADSLSVFESFGDGTFGPAVPVGSANGALAVTAGDFDADGDDDLVFTGFYEHTVNLLPADGLGGFGPQQVLTNLENGPHSVQLVDLDLSGSLDLLVSSYYQERVSMYRVFAGVLGPRELINNSAGGPIDAKAADLDGDLDEEVIVCFHSGDSLWVSENLMGGSFPDCNGNGQPDADDISNGTSADCDGDQVPDECEIDPSSDCNGDGLLDACQLAGDPALDWNGDGLLDSCPGGSPIVCSANSHSGGIAATISASGSPLLAGNACTLAAADLPLNQFSYFITSRTQGSVNPFGGGMGHLCLGAPIIRLNNPSASGAILHSGSTGMVSLLLDLPALPLGAPLQAGETLFFQLWFRDTPPGGPPTSNTSNAIAIEFR